MNGLDAKIQQDGECNSNKRCDIWLCDLTYTQQTIANEIIPFPLGLLASYGKKKLGDSVQFKIFKFPEKLIEGLSLGYPEVIGFSNYVWNLNLNYAFAEKIKKAHPGIVVVFGGPNFPLEKEERENFLVKRSAIDFYIAGEGEYAFGNLIEKLIEYNFDKDKVKDLSLENCVSIKDGRIIAGPCAARINLSEVPSPYLNGMLDEFFECNFLPLIQTCRGCPFTCLYCSESTPYYSQLSFKDCDEVAEELEYIAKKSGGNKTLNMADSNFGQYDQDFLIAKIIKNTREKYNYPEYIIVATGKINKEKVLKVAEMMGGSLRIAGSVQSTNKEVLKNIKRDNVSIETLVQLARKGAEVGGNTYSEIILALPGDTKEAHLQSIKEMSEIKFDYIRCYTLIMLPGTPLYTKKIRDEYGMVTKFRIVPRSFGTYKIGEEEINTVETEEVCVANKTLSFDDYLQCRLFDLMIEIFYNDNFLYELFNFVENFGISSYSLIKAIFDDYKNFPHNLKLMLGSFLKETEEELWDSEEMIHEKMKEKSFVERCLGGELGSNLIFKYKTLAYVDYTWDIHEITFRMAGDLIRENNDFAEEKLKYIFSFLDELKKYSMLKKKSLFGSAAEIHEDIFSFNIIQFDKDRFKGDLDAYVLKNPIKIHFTHSKEQRDIIARNLKQFGSSTIGISRILSRIFVKKIFRNPCVFGR